MTWLLCCLGGFNVRMFCFSVGPWSICFHSSWSCWRMKSRRFGWISFRIWSRWTMSSGCGSCRRASCRPSLNWLRTASGACVWPLSSICRCWPVSWGRNFSRKNWRLFAWLGWWTQVWANQTSVQLKLQEHLVSWQSRDSIATVAPLWSFGLLNRTECHKAVEVEPCTWFTCHESFWFFFCKS